MDVRRAYCSAVDRNVPVVLKSAPADGEAGPVSAHDPADLVCLDYRVRCTGWMCPLYSVSDDDEPALIALSASPGARTAPAADHPGTDPSRQVKRWSRRT